nr:DUF5711 family protein [Lachnospiraceae bacterium]
CLLAGFILIIIFIYLNINRTYDKYKVVEEYVRNDNNTKEYLSYDDDKIIRYSNDGITALDREGKAIWSYSYEMRNPKVSICEGSVAVADIGGTEVYVFDEKGNESKIDNVNKIAQVETSAKGRVALLIEDNMAYYIRICDGSTKYIDIKTRMKEDGFPIDYAFSNDGKKLVTSYMCVQDGKIDNKVTCYNLGEVGKNYESKIVAGFNYDNNIVPEVDFLNEDRFVIFSENDFVVYDMKEKPVKRFESGIYDNKIESVTYNSDYIVVVLNDTSKQKKNVKIYGMDGKIKHEFLTDYEYEKIAMGKNEVIMYTKSDARIETISGYTKFKGDFDIDIDYIIQYNKDRYFFITSEKMLKVKLVEGK